MGAALLIGAMGELPERFRVGGARQNEFVHADLEASTSIEIHYGLPWRQLAELARLGDVVLEQWEIAEHGRATPYITESDTVVYFPDPWPEAEIVQALLAEVDRLEARER